ncbi:MAG: hypothetical protein ACKESB_00295 [Candidatus Hodgkinia cicadicola]
MAEVALMSSGGGGRRRGAKWAPRRSRGMWAERWWGDVGVCGCVWVCVWVCVGVGGAGRLRRCGMRGVRRGGVEIERGCEWVG